MAVWKILTLLVFSLFSTIVLSEHCPPGYALSEFRCRNVNECAMGIDNCDEAARCSDNTGSFTCTCINEKTGDGVQCYDIDKCAVPELNHCDISATCKSQENSTLSCACNTGYTGDGKTCTSIFKKKKSECDNFVTNDCSNHAICTDLNPTGHVCMCKEGFSGNGLFCQPEIEDYLAVAALKCSVGFMASIKKGRLDCRDINECVIGMHACDKNADCRNTEGAYACTCREDYVGNGTSCTINTCQDGYKKSTFGACLDIDECATNAHSCSPNSICTNYEGGFNCTCIKGFQSSLDDASCVPVTQCELGMVMDVNNNCTDDDECRMGSHDCDINAFCQNSMGSFVCSCRNGFIGDGINCKRATVCADGFIKSGEVCEDNDECDENVHNCHADAKCTNNPGSFTCLCNFGFTGNGVTCEAPSQKTVSNDKISIAQADMRCTVCDKNGICKKLGSDLYCQCKEGWVGDGKSCVNVQERCQTGLVFDEASNECNDIDECKTKERTCSDQSTCINVYGSSYCQCKPGATSSDCVDVTEEVDLI